MRVVPNEVAVETTEAMGGEGDLGLVTSAHPAARSISTILSLKLCSGLIGLLRYTCVYPIAGYMYIILFKTETISE